MFGGSTTPRRLLGVFAHPDDEVFCAGGTMARAAEAGAEVMIVSATRGERGQIRDPAAATQRTLGAVRERELRAAAAELGVHQVRVFAYPDGSLRDHRRSLRADLAEVMGQFDPDTVITFGADGGYGHPDHVAVSRATTEAFRELFAGWGRRRRLYHAVFPPQRTSMAEELARHIAGCGQSGVDPGALQAITLFAGGAATMRLTRDDVSVAWFAAGTRVIEPDAPADALYLILDGTADALREGPSSEAGHVRRLRPGDYFGEAGLVGARDAAQVVAGKSLTCLVLSRTRRVPHAEPAAAEMPFATCAVGVTPYLRHKLGALALHRTQYPIVPSMLPDSLLQKMLGTEYFRPVHSGGRDPVTLRETTVTPDHRRITRRRRPAGPALRRTLAGRISDSSSVPAR